MNYNLNHDRLLFDNLPFKLRKVKVFSFIQSIFSPLVTVYNGFLNYRNQTNYEISISAQTIVLEKYLQMKFSNSSIEIVNATFIFNQSFLTRKDETGNAITNNYVPRKSEASTSGDLSDFLYLLRKSETLLQYDFVVRVPVAVLSTGITVAQIAAEVDRYKKIGTTYEIKII